MKGESETTEVPLVSADNDADNYVLKLEKPLGIGAIAGSFIGLLNSLILGFPLLWSIFAGAALGRNQSNDELQVDDDGNVVPFDNRLF